MNIEVGEYVRTKEGYIAKITEIAHHIWFDSIIYKESGIPEYSLSEEEYRNLVTKNSKNIIDLIEVGDFVKIEYFSNRYSKRVKRIFEVDCIIDKSVCFTNGYYTLNILNGEWANQDKEVKPIIKSIVTKEQFSNMEYRV